MPSDREVGGRPGVSPIDFDLYPLISQLTIGDDRGDHHMTTSNQPPQGEYNFGDSSGPLFSIYSKAAEDEDNKMVERWQKDADGILIFVSPRYRHSFGFVYKQENYRPVSSLPQLPPSLLSPSST